MIAPWQEQQRQDKPGHPLQRIVVHLTFSGSSPGTEADFTKQKIAEWNAANPHIQVKFLEGPVSGTDRYGLYLQTFQAKSPAIDVMLIDVIWPGDMAEHLVDFNQ